MDFSKHCLSKSPGMCIEEFLVSSSICNGSVIFSDSLQASCEKFIFFEGSDIG